MLTNMAKDSRAAARKLALLSTEDKNELLLMIADKLTIDKDKILSANHRDVEDARKESLPENLVDRLLLNDQRLTDVINDIKQVVNLPDPVGEIFDEYTHPNGMEIKKVRVPLGVIAVIYESRPNVTLDIAGLALKTGNAVILRGGSETIRTNQHLVEVIQQTLEKFGLPRGSVQLINSTDRKYVSDLLKMHEWIDMLIPRGGAALHKYCRENSTIPVITGGIGICHLYVDETADIRKAVDVVFNAKVQRPSVCNSLDTLIVHKIVAKDFLPLVVDRLGPVGVSFRVDEEAGQILSSQTEVDIEPAGPDGFDTEWLSLVLGVKVVAGFEEAVEHISVHGTGHSDGILTGNDEQGKKFVTVVDSAAVYVNASTRFTDGSQFGLGAEVAISTQRLHARGPMALKELTSYKWVVWGDNHIRE